MPLEKHLSPRQVEELSAVPVTTLAAWRHRSRTSPATPARGPAWVKLGRLVRYPQTAVQAWLGHREPPRDH